MNKLLFSYRDIDIYERDAVLFNEGEWLNDSCLSYAFKRIEDKIYIKQNKIKRRYLRGEFNVRKVI